MRKRLYQFHWIRLLLNRTFFFHGGEWKPIEEFRKGMKVERVEGPEVYNQNWCECGNELVYSQSFINENESHVWEYKCSHCSKHQYWNPWLIPGCIPSDQFGKPL